MGALAVLSLKQNSLGTKDAGEAIGEMLKGNTVLKELDLSENHVQSYNGGDALGFVQGISRGLLDNRALSFLNLSNNNLGQLGAEDWTYDSSEDTGEEWQHIDGSKRHRNDPPPNSKPEGIIALANALPDMRAMTRLDARENELDDEGKRALQQAAGSRCRT
jgi:hypothetical protein